MLNGNQRKHQKKRYAGTRKLRRAAVMKELVAGLNQREIAEKLGCSVGAVNGDIKAVFAELDEATAYSALQFRALELHRLDRLTAAIWRKALCGAMPAIDRVIKIMERRAKMLGLDAPAKFDLLQLDDETLLRLVSECEEEGEEPTSVARDEAGSIQAPEAED